MTAALEDSKQREGLTAHKLSQCEQQLLSLPSTLPSTHEDHLKFSQCMYSSISVVT